MDHLQFMFAGFAAFWAALLVYLLVLQGRVHALEREVGRLEERLAESADAATHGHDAPPARVTDPRAARAPEPSSRTP